LRYRRKRLRDEERIAMENRRTRALTKECAALAKPLYLLKPV
jgi:hypothetical protein